jgi:hypothetical protein
VCGAGPSSRHNEFYPLGLKRSRCTREWFIAKFA